jgi:hypothetical protein
LTVENRSLGILARDEGYDWYILFTSLGCNPRAIVFLEVTTLVILSAAKELISPHLLSKRKVRLLPVKKFLLQYDSSWDL